MFKWAKGWWLAAEPTATGDVELIGAPVDINAEPPLMEAMLRFEQAHRRRSLQEMRACFHDEALIESVASNGQALGPDETAEALGRAMNDGVYSIRDWRYEELEPQVALSWTGARRLVGDARMRDEVVCRLHVGRDGLMWRVKLVADREEALEHLRQFGPTLGLG
jgi:hypothetical protein